MQLFSPHSTRLTEIKDKPFKLEREIQRIFEANLQAIMGLQLVKSEFTIKNKRIDTLAFDPQSGGFIIIEYKRDRSMSVVDQGFSYLSLMLENKADFIIEYNESLKQNLKRDEVDWSQTRVVFVSTSFTENQVQATNFKDLAIELWEVKQFENETILIRPIKKSAGAESIKPVVQNKENLKKVAEEIKVYSEEDHLGDASELILETYQKFRLAIVNLAEGVEVVPVKHWLNFARNGKIFASVIVRKAHISLTINRKFGTIVDAENLARDVSRVGHSGNGDYQIKVEDDSKLEYIMSLVKQTLIP
jgi:predicted transport protein